MELLSLILTVVVCVCCALLFTVMVYLCIVVRRIRRDLNNLTKDQHLVYTDPNDNGQDEKTKEENRRKRESSSATRYIIDPVKGKSSHRQSSMHLDPEETVTYLTRAGEKELSAPAPTASTSSQVADEQRQLHQFVNPSFDPDISHDHRDSSSDSSSDIRSDPQPIYSNEAYEDEQPIYENNPTEEPEEEPVYQNRGELALINNPERPRLHTMDISDIA